MSPKYRGAGTRRGLPLISLERFATSSRADFRFAPLNVLLLVGLFVAGLVVHLSLYPFSLHAVLLSLGSAVVLSVLLRLTQVWEAVVILATANSLAAYLELRPESEILIGTTIVAVLVAPAIQIAYQWERAVLLRFGKFRCLKKSGLFLVVPVIDKVAQFVDQRIRVTDFTAETTLTADTVPVNVDAIAFWMVWDAQKAVLEVEHFDDAVVLSAQTALRNAIGKNDLAVLLSERDRLGHEIQKLLDEKTSAWGVTTQAVEIRDIIIPKNLEDAMSRQAQAERERQSRIILGTAETEIAEKFAKASEHYRGNAVALHLRAMNMVFEGLRQKGSMIIVPSTAVETMGLGALGGLTSFGRGDLGQTPQAGGASDGGLETQADTVS
ncbi:MAG: slipin family protein [Gemmatimonadota bacterium]|nr:MAG: slipin family protein [Gemmatimonadota bacterium]